MKSVDAPEILDDARVLSTALGSPEHFSEDTTSGLKVPIHYWAVAQYPDHPCQGYLFGVSADHKVLCDFVFDSSTEAVRYAQDEDYIVGDFTPTL